MAVPNLIIVYKYFKETLMNIQADKRKLYFYLSCHYDGRGPTVEKYVEMCHLMNTTKCFISSGSDNSPPHTER